MSTDLLPRLQAAEGPDRALDAEIAVAFRILPDFDPTRFIVPIEYMVDERRGAGVAAAYWLDKRGDPFFVHSRHVPEYTASIDAVLSLMPDGFSWIIRTGTKEGDGRGRTAPYAHCWTCHDDKGKYEGYAATPVLALLTAILKARQP